MVGSVLADEESFHAAALIPVYDHEEAIGQTLQQVLEYDCPVLLVDDGSRESCRRVLEALRDKYPERVSLLQLPRNAGKGAAVKAGFQALFDKGYSHAVQIDADGQHDISDLPEFLLQGEKYPHSLICGYPQFDENVPRMRFYFRYLTHVWVWINTLSFSIRDSMCGFRVYPLSAVMALIEKDDCGNRMAFDTEVIVRWSWRGGKIVSLPTRVGYPLDGVSHFLAWKDNLLITQMHTRLFFGMLRRLPQILGQRING